jgi:hypothetical protein
MSYDDRCLRWRKANVPFIVNSRRVRSSLLTTTVQGAYETPTELHGITIASRCRWDEVRVCSAICCSDQSTTCPILQNESIEDVPPQLKFNVVLGLQYAALAKDVKGMNDEIWAELRVVMMLCLLAGWTSSNPGAALTIDASSKGKMKPANSILGMGANLKN